MITRFRSNLITNTLGRNGLSASCGMVLWLIGAGSAAAQWPQWGGPAGDFVAQDSRLAASWPDGGPRKIWTRELGDGYSAILVENDRLYTMYRGDDRERAIALDAKTGETIWEFAYDSQPSEEHVKQFGTGPRATPALDGDRLFAVGVSGTMHCLDKRDGKPQWSKELWRELKGSVLNHGYSSSPMPYKELVIVMIGGEDHAIVALNQSDGTIAWAKHGFENSFASPKLISVDGEDQLVCMMDGAVVGLRPADGELLWQYTGGDQFRFNASQPIWGPDNILFISAPEAGSRGLRLKRQDGRTSVEELWSTRKVQFSHVTAVRVGDYVYGCTGGGQGPAFMAAINIRDGNVAWRERGFVKSTTLLAGGYLLVLQEDGELVLATASPEKLTVHSRAAVLERVAWTVPTVVGKTAYVRDLKSIAALDLG